MSEQYAVHLDNRRGDDARCITLQRLPNSRPRRLAIGILGPDQEATEFLSQKRFEELVAVARRIMNWREPE